MRILWLGCAGTPPLRVALAPRPPPRMSPSASSALLAQGCHHHQHHNLHHWHNHRLDCQFMRMNKWVNWEIIMNSVENAGSLTVVHFLKSSLTVGHIFRKGWKIMADDGQPIEGPALKTVVGMIKDMEYQVQSPKVNSSFGKFWMSFPGVQRSRKNHDQDAIATPFCQEPTYRTSIYANMLNVYNLNTNGCQLEENYTKSRKWRNFWKPGSLQPLATAGPLTLCTLGPNLIPAVMRSCVGSFLPSDDFDFSSDRKNALGRDVTHYHKFVNGNRVPIAHFRCRLKTSLKRKSITVRRGISARYITLVQ